MRLIKKYKNRRLYDTEISQYITIEELQRYVIQGILFRVEDSATGKDITNTSLLQILVEREEGPSSFFSTDILRQLIVLANHPLSQAFKTGLEEFFSTIEKSLSNHPYLDDYKKVSSLWNYQMQEFLKQWQVFFR